MAGRKPQVPCPTRRLPRHLPTPGHPTEGRGVRLGLSLRGARVSRCGDSRGGVLAGLGWVQLSLPGRTTSEGSAASSTAGARSSRPAWCAPSRGRRAPRRTLTSWVSGSLPQPPGREPPPAPLAPAPPLSLQRMFSSSAPGTLRTPSSSASSRCPGEPVPRRGAAQHPKPLSLRWVGFADGPPAAVSSAAPPSASTPWLPSGRPSAAPSRTRRASTTAGWNTRDASPTPGPAW